MRLVNFRIPLLPCCRGGGGCLAVSEESGESVRCSPQSHISGRPRLLGRSPHPESVKKPQAELDREERGRGAARVGCLLGRLAFCGSRGRRAWEMVRFKNRFLVVELIWGEGARAPAELSSKALDKALRESLSRNFGIIGVARTNWSLQGTAHQERGLLWLDATWLLSCRETHRVLRLRMALLVLKESFSAVKHCDPAASIAVIRTPPPPLTTSPVPTPIRIDARRHTGGLPSAMTWLAGGTS